MSLNPVRPFSAGEPLSASKLNMLRDTSWIPISGSGGITVSQTPSGVVVSGRNIQGALFAVDSLSRESEGDIDDDVLSALGYRLLYVPETNEHLVDNFAVRIYFPALPIWDIYAIRNIETSSWIYKRAIVRAVFNPGSGRWESDLQPSRIFRAILLGPISYGLTGLAKLIRSPGADILDPFKNNDPVTLPVVNATGRDLPDGSEVVIARHGSHHAWLIISAHHVGYKPYAVFQLSEDLETTDLTAQASIVEQYGPGAYNPANPITVYNLHQGAGTYLFEGKSGTLGFAVHDTGSAYRIVMLPCRAEE